MAKKYIDADELLKRLNDCKYPAQKTTMRQVTYNAAISDVCRSVDAMPAADVVEVVRCKECKHREYDDFMKDFVCDLDAADPYDRSRCAEDDEWFCKDGERTR